MLKNCVGRFLIIVFLFFNINTNLYSMDALAVHGNDLSIETILKTYGIDVPEFLFYTYSQPLYTFIDSQHRTKHESIDRETKILKKKIFYTPQGIYIAIQKPNPSTNSIQLKYNPIVWDVYEYKTKKLIFENVVDVEVVNGHHMAFFKIRMSVVNPKYKLFILNDFSLTEICAQAQSFEIEKTNNHVFIIEKCVGLRFSHTENLYYFDENNLTSKMLVSGAKEVKIYQAATRDFVELTLDDKHYLYDFDYLFMLQNPWEALRKKKDNPWDRIADSHMRRYISPQKKEINPAILIDKISIDEYGFLHVVRNGKEFCYSEDDLSTPLTSQEIDQRRKEKKIFFVKNIWHGYRHGVALIGEVKHVDDTKILNIFHFLSTIKKTYSFLKTQELKHVYISNVFHMVDYCEYIRENFKARHVQYLLAHLSYIELKKLTKKDFVMIEKIFMFSEGFKPSAYETVCSNLHEIIMKNKDISKALEDWCRDLSVRTDKLLPIEVLAQIAHGLVDYEFLRPYIFLLGDEIPRTRMRNSIFLEYPALHEVYMVVINEFYKCFPSKDLIFLCDHILFITNSVVNKQMNKSAIQKLYFAV